MKKLIYSFIFIALFGLAQEAGATVYYADLTANPHADTTCSATGTSTSSPFCSLDAFTEAARVAGDILFVRRGNIATTSHSAGLGDLNFTSDGTIANPLIISSDYDNLWRDFATSSETWTVEPGSHYMISSASTTTAFPNEWIYIQGDCNERFNPTTINQCEFAYEIELASSTGIKLYLPYKGNQNGSGKEMRVMPNNSIWNFPAGDFQFLLNGDENWFVKGLGIYGTDTAGQIGVSNSYNLLFVDNVFIGNGVTSRVVAIASNDTSIEIRKSRATGETIAFNATTVGSTGTITLKDFLLVQNGNNFINSGNNVSTLIRFFFDSVYVQGTATIDCSTAATWGCIIESRNSKITNTFDMLGSIAAESFSFEDSEGVVGDNKYYAGFGIETLATIRSTTTASALRPGGGSTSIEVNPLTNTTNTWHLNNIKIFEYPIYTDTSSKQYDVYFKSPSDTWTTNPTASELWIECEYWTHQTGATSTRKVKKSTGTLDLNGSTDWQSLSVTCQPTQTGILYLRGWYAKTKEAGTNLFYVDNTPVITP